jgi:hypothetical protein
MQVLRNTITSLSRTTRMLLVFGLSLPALGWFYWMNCVGPSWWYAYYDAEPGGISTGAAAERVMKLMWLIGVCVAFAAPFFSQISVGRRFLFAAIGGILALSMYYVSGFIVMYGLYGF